MTRHIPAIVFTGELDEEKKHILEKTAKHFTEQGYTVAIVPDMAAELLANNCGPGRIGMVPFHEYVLQLTINGEREAAHQLATKDNPIMFVCRGAMDGAAWLEAEEIENVWDLEGYTRVHLRDKRYSGVLHIPARDLRIQAHDDRTLAVWVGTPHLGYVEHNLSLDERVRQAIAWVTSFISGVEHERRWLIIPPFDRAPLPAHARRIDIQQTYVRLPNETKDHRYRMRGEDNTYLFTKVQKRKTGHMSSDDDELTIDEQAFVADIFQYRVPGYATVVKHRWCYVVNGQYHEHDVLRDLPIQVLEIEIPHPEWQVTLPSWIGDAIEITGQPGYANRDFSAKINAMRLAA